MAPRKSSTSKKQKAPNGNAAEQSQAGEQSQATSQSPVDTTQSTTTTGRPRRNAGLPSKLRETAEPSTRKRKRSDSRDKATAAPGDKAGRKWTFEESCELAALSPHKSRTEIGDILGRTELACRLHLHHLKGGSLSYTYLECRIHKDELAYLEEIGALDAPASKKKELLDNTAAERRERLEALIEEEKHRRPPQPNRNRTSPREQRDSATNSDPPRSTTTSVPAASVQVTPVPSDRTLSPAVPTRTSQPRELPGWAAINQAVEAAAEAAVHSSPPRTYGWRDATSTQDLVSATAPTSASSSATAPASASASSSATTSASASSSAATHLPANGAPALIPGTYRAPYDEATMEAAHTLSTMADIHHLRALTFRPRMDVSIPRLLNHVNVEPTPKSPSATPPADLPRELGVYRGPSPARQA